MEFRRDLARFDLDAAHGAKATEPEIKIVKEEIKKTKEEPKVCKYKWIVVPSCQKASSKKKSILACYLI